MKILIITLHADPTINPGAEEGGGTHLYINEIINLLVYKQVEALVITRKASPGQDFFEYGSVKIKRISIGPAASWNKDNLDELEGPIKDHIKEELDRLKYVPDLIHSVYWHSGRAALFFAKIFDIPWVHTIISLGQKKLKTGFQVSENRLRTEQKIFEGTGILISISEQEKQEVVSYYNIPEDKIKVVGRGVDNLFLKQLYDSKGTLLPKSIDNLPVNPGTDD